MSTTRQANSFCASDKLHINRNKIIGFCQENLLQENTDTKVTETKKNETRQQIRLLPPPVFTVLLNVP